MKSFDSSSQINWIPDSPNDLIRQYKTVSKQQQTAARVRVAQWIWNTVLKPLTGNMEPQIVERCDRHGNRYFHVYDPVSGQSFNFDSEQEIRCWLDQRYYQSYGNPK